MSKKLKFLAMMLTCVVLSINHVWADSSWSLTYTDFSTASYSANDGGHEKEGISYSTQNVMQSSSKIQIKKNGSPYIYNTTEMPGDITSITLTSGSNVVIKVGSTQAPSSGTIVSSGASVSSGNRYFYITSNGSTATVTTITVNYSTGSTKTFPFVSRVFSLANQLIFSLLGYVCDMVKLLFLCHTTILIINQLRFVLFNLPRKFKFFTMSMYIAILFLVLIAYTIVYAYAYVHMRMRLFFQTAVHRTVFPFWSSLVTNHLAFPKIEFFILF